MVGNVLTCYADHQHLRENKGEVFLFGESELHRSTEFGRPHCFVIRNPFDPIQLAARTPADEQLWMSYLEHAIEV